MSHKRVLASIPVLSGPATHLEVELYYNIGGMNYFQSVVMPRGLYLSASPVTKTPNSRISTAFSGNALCVLEMKKFNQKTLDNYVVDEEVKERMIRHVASKNGLVLQEAVSLP